MLLNILIIALTVILIVTGLLGSVVPIIPGPILILIGSFVYAWHTDFLNVNWVVLGILAFLALISQALDYLASVIGAKKFGASRWGIIGSFAGGIVGIFFGIFGILIGPFLGAVLFEMLTGKKFNSSFKIGFGTLVGFLGGTIGRVVIALTMTGIFLTQVFFQ
jgi:uncharacterized protein YqgC (DUF456 family)